MINNETLKLIKDFEGLKLTQYYCSSNVSTIGWGTTLINGKPVPKGLKITEKQADEYLIEDIARFEAGVRKLLNVEMLNANQYGAIVSFSYNCGIGNLKSSTLLKKIKANPNDPDIAYQFSRWTRSNGVVMRGLERRRSAESALYFKPIIKNN
jgi:lysozyme